ncbi:TPA: cation transporter [Klebsiella pneumoniae]
MKNYIYGLGGGGRRIRFIPEPSQAILIVASLNLIYFFIEFIIADQLGSLSLYADSVDFLEDAFSGFLILFTMSLSAKHRAVMGRSLSVLMLIPGIAFLISAISKVNASVPPEGWLLTLTGVGALLINCGCALLMARFRLNNTPVTLAAFLTARNDVMASIALIVTGLVTVYWQSAWPDILTGTAIFIMNINAAKVIWLAASSEESNHLSN